MESEELRGKLLSEDIQTYKTLLANVPPDHLARIARALLELSMLEVPVGKEVANVAKTAANPDRWRQGHAAFDLVRDRVLEWESKDTAPSDSSYYVLLVAENAARVIYNATEPLDPFDDDSGAWLVMTFIQLSRRLNSSSLVERALNVFRDEATA